MEGKWVEALNGLVEYGILGMWTLSLLVSNHTMRKNFQSRYDDLNKMWLILLKETTSFYNKIAKTIKKLWKS
jgi:hypothetical protein